jgi:transcription elongation factor
VVARDLDFSEVQFISGKPSDPPSKSIRNPRDPLVGHKVTVIYGHYKGFKGRIKDTNLHKATAHVELEAGVRTLMFPFINLYDDT